MNLTDGSLYLNVQYTVAQPVGSITTLGLNTGDNTVIVPSLTGQPTTVIIQFPAGNTNLVKLKQVGGDSGVPLHKTAPTFLSIDTTEVTFILNAAAPVAGVAFTWI